MALAAAYQQAAQPELDVQRGPQFVIYCTDGEPNSCENGGVDIDYTARQAVVDQVTAAAQSGIKTYVIAIAVSTSAKVHLDKVANAGATGAPAYSPTTKDELTQVITQIVNKSVGCNLTLSDRVTRGKECLGRVELDSKPLKCNDANGWKLTDETHIKLVGTACDSYLYDTTAMVNATFPCDVLLK
jgi:hypothetical protein